MAQRGLHEPEELRVEGGVELAIDLDGDEVRVEQRRDVGVGEALPLHHMAPVAGEVADGDEDQPVLDPARATSSGLHSRQCTGSCACSRR